MHMKDCHKTAQQTVIFCYRSPMLELYVDILSFWGEVVGDNYDLDRYRFCHRPLPRLPGLRLRVRYKPTGPYSSV